MDFYPQAYTPQFNVLLIGSNSSIREGLINTGKITGTINNVKQSKSLLDALTRLRRNEKFDILFLPHHLSAMDIGRFVDAAKQTEAGNDSAYILLVQNGETVNATIGCNLILGIDGFLCEPFSANTVSEIVAIATQVKISIAKQRIEAGVRALIRGAIEEINYRAVDVANGYGRFSLSHEIVQGCKTFRKFNDYELNAYFELLIKLFTTIQVPHRVQNVNNQDSVDKVLQVGIPRQIIFDLRSSDRNIRWRAVESVQQLARSDPELVSKLTRLIREDTSSARLTGIRALKAIGSREALAALKRATEVVNL